jgi:hypothetical protein
MKWYEKSLEKNNKEVIAGAIFSFTFALALLLWNFGFGKSFEWQNITPFSAPPLLYEIYSAITFVTLGAFLYWIKFYKFLHFIFVEVLGDWHTYKSIKALIWLILIGFIYWIVLKIIDVINITISFFYNILNVFLYVSPPLGAALIISMVGYIILKGRKPAIISTNVRVAKK